MQPIRDQNTAKISWESVQAASRYNLPTFHTTPDEFKDLPINRAIEVLNSETSNGHFLPLEFCPLILKKFSSIRMGSLHDAETIYSKICSLYADIIGDKDNKIVTQIHAEMMQLHIQRETHDINRVLQIYNNYPVRWTYNAVMEFFNTEKRYNETLQWYNNWPFLPVKPDSYAERHRLKAILQQSGYQPFKTACEQIQDPNILHESHFLVFYLIEYFTCFQDRLAYFETLPQDKKTDEVCREILKGYFSEGRIIDALDFFNKWPCKKTLRTLFVVIGNMATVDRNFAKQLFSQSYSEKKQLQYAVDEHVNRYGPNRLSLNLHNTATMGGGGQSYGGLQKNVAEIFVEYLVEEILSTKQGNARYIITLITGQGKHVLRDHIDAFVKRTYNWQTRLEHGTVVISGTVQELTQKPTP